MAATPEGLFSASLPELYERFLVEPLFRPFAEVLIDRVGLAEGDRLLDVACGTGIVARLAHQRLGDRGRVVGVDASPAMLAMAKSVAPQIDWREGDAARLPVGGGETFDAISCHQGLQFFADKSAAVSEMRRVLAPGGRLAIGTWRPVADIALMRDLHRVAERHLGPSVDQRHSFGDPDAMKQLLEGAGFTDVRVEAVTRTVRMTGADVFPRLNTMAIVGMSAAAKAMSDEQRANVVAAITKDSIDATSRYVEGDDFVFDLVSNLAIAKM
jgi:ubiquinone/menaquinone biosynthesis C-methylase UbiE